VIVAGQENGLNTVLNSSTSPNPFQSNSGLKSGATSVSAAVFAVICLCATLATGHSYAKDGAGERTRSILDRPLRTNERASANNRGNQGNQSGRARAARELRRERAQLRRMNERQLRREAAKGERLAQMILAEILADEAQQLINSPMMANDALSEALSWYAVAAKRGQTSDQATLAIDNLIPTPVIRAIRRPL